MGICPFMLEKIDPESGDWREAWEHNNACPLPLRIAAPGGYIDLQVSLGDETQGTYRIKLPPMGFGITNSNIYPVYTPPFTIKEAVVD